MLMRWILRLSTRLCGTYDPSVVRVSAMSLRIGIDLDGTLADLSSIYHEYEAALFGQPSTERVVEPDEPPTESTDKEKLKAAKDRSSRHDTVWRALKNTPDLWTLLKPLESDTVRVLYEAASRHAWEVFFVTQRPKTAGASVQRQTQEWLIAQGFKTPSVLTLSGSRGKAAHALDLDFLIDDLPKNCVDVISDSKCRPILILRDSDAKAEEVARRMSIGVVRSVAEAIALLEQPVTEPRTAVIGRILKALGFSR